MEFSAQLLFFFSALGAFNGLILAAYFLFFAQPKTLTNKLLGMLILMLSIRVGKSVFFWFNPDLAFDYLQLGLTACLFIGPFLYCYIKSLVKPQSNIKTEWKYHIALTAVVAAVVGYLYPFEENVALWRPTIIRSIYAVWIIYILLSAYVARHQIKKIFMWKRSNHLDIWVMSLISGNLLLVTIYETMDFTFYISGALSFSILLYVSWAYLFFNRDNRIYYISEQKKYGDQKIEKSEADQLKASLSTLMEDEELYKQPSLKLPMVAEKLHTNPHRLSQYLNDNLNKSFSQFINEHRVDKATKLIMIKDHLTLEAIGYEVGFSSKSTFYSSFKKHTGSTPAAYKKSLLKQRA